MAFLLGFDGQALHFLQFEQLSLLPVQLLLQLLLVLLALLLLPLVLLLLYFGPLNLSLFFVELAIAYFLGFRVLALGFLLFVEFVGMGGGGGVVELVDCAFHY